MLQLLACLHESAERLAQGQRRVGHAPLGPTMLPLLQAVCMLFVIRDESNNFP